MISIKDLTEEELNQQIKNAMEDLDNAEYGTGDYNNALAELEVAKKEKSCRKK